jgi:hypothetical protein
MAQFANVDTVYQTVLALANKEQRGYITPQEFNLFARQAQMEIFEQYFYDLDQAKRSLPSSSSEFTPDAIEIIEEKLSRFIYTEPLTVLGSGYAIPNDCYKASTVDVVTDKGLVYVEKITKDESAKINSSGYLTRPTVSRPHYYQIRNTIFISPNPQTAYSGGNATVNFSYYKKPAAPNWTYMVVNDKAIYNSNNSTSHFGLDKSEERDLVLKILQMAGVSIKDFSLVQVAGQADQNTVLQQKR